MMPALRTVGLGSSAGGLDPTIEFFKAMPPDCGLAFVVIQHLSGDAPILTPTILSRFTTMKVGSAVDQAPVVANNVYTIPPNGALTIADGRLHLAPRTEAAGRHKPFDRFLHSLASDCRERAIAVIFSGYDGDGSEGFVAIKAHGGVTYAQDRSARVDDMPENAIATGCVDHVLSPVQIARMIATEHRC